MERLQNRKRIFSAYLQKNLKPDFTAAMTIAMIAVPQAMAYAAIAGVGPVFGLYAAILPAILGAIFGNSNHVVTGPTNAVALATSGVLLAFITRGNFLEYIFAMAILSGVFKLLFGVLKLGSLIRYVSNSVLTGFLAGAAVLIVLNQLPKFLGLSAPTGHTLWEIVAFMSRQIANTDLFELAIGMICVLFLVIVGALLA